MYELNKIPKKKNCKYLKENTWPRLNYFPYYIKRKCLEYYNFYYNFFTNSCDSPHFILLKWVLHELSRDSLRAF
jgi:hypothetical protein